jgi:hypothetical protein
MPVVFSLGWHVTRVPPRATSLSLQEEPTGIGKGCSRPTRRTRGSGDRSWIPKPSPQGGGTSHGARRLQERQGDWDGPMEV